VHVDKIVKLLKTKVSILEKFLDTAFHWPIRFRQKVLMVFFELRWNYSPLKEKAVLLPGGLFIYLSGRSATNRPRAFVDIELFLLLMRAARRPRASRLGCSTEFVAMLHHRLRELPALNTFCSRCRPFKQRKSSAAQPIP
jgi:hypothetical protein